MAFSLLLYASGTAPDETHVNQCFPGQLSILGIDVAARLGLHLNVLGHLKDEVHTSVLLIEPPMYVPAGADYFCIFMSVTQT